MILLRALNAKNPFSGAKLHLRSYQQSYVNKVLFLFFKNRECCFSYNKGLNSKNCNLFFFVERTFNQIRIYVTSHSKFLKIILYFTALSMNEPLQERSKTLERLIKKMMENGYKDEDLYLSLKVQSQIKNIKSVGQYNIDLMKNSVRQSEEYTNAFDNIEIQTVKTSDICCLTQTKIKDRWENKCGHVFEKSAVINYKKAKKNALCPAVGCNVVLAEKVK